MSVANLEERERRAASCRFVDGDRSITRKHGLVSDNAQCAHVKNANDFTLLRKNFKKLRTIIIIVLELESTNEELWQQRR